MSDEITKEGEWAYRSYPTTQVEILTLNCPKMVGYPVVSMDMDPGDFQYHKTSGRDMICGGVSPFDIVKLQRELRVWYVNVYQHICYTIYATREEADLCASDNRTECVEVVEVLE